MRRPPDPWRKQQRARNREMRARGQKVCRMKRIWRVRVTEIEMPDWALLQAVKGLSAADDAVWLLPTAAWTLARLDREAGGDPEMTESEYRRCEICRRPLLAEDAEARRRLTQSATTGHMKPCGIECFAAARDRRWKHR